MSQSTFDWPVKVLKTPSQMVQSNLTRAGQVGAPGEVVEEDKVGFRGVSQPPHHRRTRAWARTSVVWKICRSAGAGTSASTGRVMSPSSEKKASKEGMIVMRGCVEESVMKRASHASI